MNPGIGWIHRDRDGNREKPQGRTDPRGQEQGDTHGSRG